MWTGEGILGPWLGLYILPALTVEFLVTVNSP
jgi:hypothetical protein